MRSSWFVRSSHALLLILFLITSLSIPAATKQTHASTTQAPTLPDVEHAPALTVLPNPPAAEPTFIPASDIPTTIAPQVENLHHSPGSVENIFTGKRRLVYILPQPITLAGEDAPYTIELPLGIGIYDSVDVVATATSWDSLGGAYAKIRIQALGQTQPWRDTVYTPRPISPATSTQTTTTRTVSIGQVVPEGEAAQVSFDCQGKEGKTSCTWTSVTFYQDIEGWRLTNVSSGYPSNTNGVLPSTTLTATMAEGSYTTDGYGTIAADQTGDSFLAIESFASSSAQFYLASPIIELPSFSNTTTNNLTISIKWYEKSSSGQSINDIRLRSVTKYGEPIPSGHLFGNANPPLNTWQTITSAPFSTTLSGKRVQFFFQIGVGSTPRTIGIDDFTFYLGGQPFTPRVIPADQLPGYCVCDQSGDVEVRRNDPVNTASGAFILPEKDIDALYSVAPLSFARTYVSLLANTNIYSTTTMGAGWRHSFATSLTLPNQRGGEPRTLIFEAPTGNRYRFYLINQVSKSIYAPAPGVRMRLSTKDTNNNGKLEYTVTTAGNRVFEFDENGRLLSEKNEKGHQVTFSYNNATTHNGALAYVTDEESGRQLIFDYTYANDYVNTVRLWRVRDNFNRSVTFAYDTIGRLQSVTDLRGGVTEYRYENANSFLIAEVENPDNAIIVRNTYTNGRVTQQEEVSKDNIITYAYTTNAYGPLTTITRTRIGTTVQEVSQDQYRPDGTLRWQVQNGELRNYVTWGQNFAPTALVDARGEVTKITSNTGGLPTSITNALSQTSSFAYDTGNRLVRAVDPMGRQSTYLYDTSHNLIRSTIGITNSFLGYTSVYTYTSDNRLQEQRGPDGVVTRYDYDAIGRVITATLGLGTYQAQTTTYAYTNPAIDTADNKVYWQQHVTTGYGTTAARTDITVYNADGTVHKTIQNYVDGVLGSSEVGTDLTTTFGYDLQGRRVWVRDALGRYSNVTRYDDAGRVLWTTRNFTGYDLAAGVSIPALPLNFAPSSPDSNVSTFYTYDQLNRVSQVRQTGILTGTFNTGTRTFSSADERVTKIEYDSSSRPITTTLNFKPNATPGPDVNVQTITYYDGAGNVIWQRDPLGRWTKSEYDELNRLVKTIVNYEDGVAGSLGPGSSLWASVDDTDLVSVMQYRPDGQIDRTIDNFVDGNFVATQVITDRVTLYEYDAIGRPITTTLTYDPATLSDPSRTDTNRTSVTFYDPVRNRPWGVQDALGRWLSYHYDALGRIDHTLQNCRSTNDQPIPTNCPQYDPLYPDRNVREITTFHPLGWPEEVEDVLGHTQTTVYNRLGWQTATVLNASTQNPAPPDLNVTTGYDYDILGRLTQVTNPTQHSTGYVYDGLDRTVEVTDPQQRVRRMGYDGVGTQRWTETPDGRFTMLLTDGLGRVTHTIVNYEDGDPTGDPADVDLMTRTVYDEAGRRLETIDAGGRKTRYGYNLLDQLTVVTENATQGTCAVAPCNVMSTYGYDRLGNRTRITNARGHTRRFTYDAADRMVAAIDALGRTTEYRYDRGGRLVLIDDPRGTQDDVTYSYDGVDRPVGISATNLPAPISMTYNGVGWRTGLTDQTGTTSFVHDELGRIETVTLPSSAEVGYRYDASGRRRQLIYPSSSVIDYHYWNDGQLKEVLAGSTVLASYLYDSAGRVDSVTLDNGAITDYIFDGADRLTERHTTVGGTTRARFVYTPDRLGLRTQVSETLGSTTRTVAYTYDGLLRLDTATESPGTTYDYDYDLAGNRTQVMENNQVVETRSYDAADQVVGWSYDAAGNLLNDGTTSYTYDALGRQLSRGATTFTYNGDAELVGETTGSTTTTYVPDLVSPLSQMLVTGSLTHIYGAERLFTVTPLGYQWHVHDALGSVRQLLDSSGNDLSSFQYDPWGKPANGTAFGFGFTGELQKATGATYLRARWYDAANSRFPAARWRTSESNPEVPLSNHAYVYGLNNPVLYTDAPGTCSGPGCGKSVQPTEEDSPAKCIQRGGYWDVFFQECRPYGGFPPPTEEEETRPNRAQPGQGLLDELCEVNAFRGPRTRDVIIAQVMVMAPMIPSLFTLPLPSIPNNPPERPPEDPTPTPDDSVIVFHYTSVASAQAIATSGTYSSQIKGPMGFGMYLTSYDHQLGFNGYRLSQQELQFGLRSTPRSTWSSQPVDGYVKLRIPRRLLRHDGLQKTFYGMTARGGQYPDVSEDEQKAYNSIRKSFLFYALPTLGNGSKPGGIDIRQYVVEWGSTQFR